MISLGLSRDKVHIVVQFSYNMEFVERVKTLPGRRWSKREGWLVPLTVQAIDRLKELFPTEDLTISSELLEFKEQHTEQMSQTILEKDAPTILPNDFVFITPPFQHQKKACSLALSRRNFALFMEMGTGKTKVILDLLGYLQQHRSPGRVDLVVCPLSVTENWVLEAKKHQPSLTVGVIRGASSEAKKEHAQELVALGMDVLVINYESAWRIEDALSKLSLGSLVLDESTKIKSRTAQQAKALVRLGAKAQRRYILTGTPMPNGPHELFNQIKFLDPTVFGTSFYAFRDRYAVMGGFKNYQIVGWKNMPELSSKLAGISYRVRKAECLDLPEKLYKEYRLDMTDEQRKSYDKMAEELVTEIQGVEVTVSVVLAKLAKLRQLTSGFAYHGGAALEFKKNPKLEQLKELLAPIFREGHKVVIWTTFLHEVDVITRMIAAGWPDAHIGRIDGRVEGSLRADVIKAFQEDPRMPVLIGQQRTGGLGITLTAGSYCIYFSNDFSPEIRLQTEDRLHRIGQKKNVTYIDLIMRNSIDVTIQRMLRKKQELSNAVIEKSLKEVIYGGKLDY